MSIFGRTFMDGYAKEALDSPLPSLPPSGVPFIDAMYRWVKSNGTIDVDGESKAPPGEGDSVEEEVGPTSHHAQTNHPRVRIPLLDQRPTPLPQVSRVQETARRRSLLTLRPT